MNRNWFLFSIETDIFHEDHQSVVIAASGAAEHPCSAVVNFVVDHFPEVVLTNGQTELPSVELTHKKQSMPQKESQKETSSVVSKLGRRKESAIVFWECSYPDCSRNDTEHELRICWVCGVAKLHSACAKLYRQCLTCAEKKSKNKELSDGTIPAEQVTHEKLFRPDYEEDHLQNFMEVSNHFQFCMIKTI
jgi:hypothetical protein